MASAFVADDFCDYSEEELNTILLEIEKYEQEALDESDIDTGRGGGEENGSSGDETVFGDI